MLFVPPFYKYDDPASSVIPLESEALAPHWIQWQPSSKDVCVSKEASVCNNFNFLERPLNAIPSSPPVKPTARYVGYFSGCRSVVLPSPSVFGMDVCVCVFEWQPSVAPI